MMGKIKGEEINHRYQCKLMKPVICFCSSICWMLDKKIIATAIVFSYIHQLGSLA